MSVVELNARQCSEWSVFLMQVAGALGRKQLTRMRFEEVEFGHGAVKATIWDQDGKEFSKVLP